MRNEKFSTKLSLLSKDLLTLLSIQEAIDKIESFAAPFSDADFFYENKVHFDAVLMNFVVIGVFSRTALLSNFNLQENVLNLSTSL